MTGVNKVYSTSSSSYQKADDEFEQLEKQFRAFIISDPQKTALVHQVETSSDAAVQEIVAQAKKIKYYTTRPFSNLKRAISEISLDRKLSVLRQTVSDKALKHLAGTRFTKMQFQTILQLMKNSLRSSSYVARCYHRFSSLQKNWERFEASKKQLPYRIILSISFILEAAVDRLSYVRPNTINHFPYYILGRTVLINYDKKKMYIVSKKSTHWEARTGGSKVCRIALEVDFSSFSSVRTVAAVKTRAGISYTCAKEEFAMQEKIKNLPHIAAFDFSVKCATKFQKTDIGFKQLFAIMPLYHNDLRNIVRQEARGISMLSEDNKVTIALELLQGLNALHEKKIIHGDIKCGNVFLSTDSEKVSHAYLGDFGLSTFAKTSYHTSIYGTPYASDPTLLSPSARLLFKGDYTKSDMFAFGILLYHIVYHTDPSWKSEMEAIYAMVRKQAADQQNLFSLRESAFDKICTFRSKIQQKLVIAFDEETHVYRKKSGCTKIELLEYLMFHLFSPFPEFRFSAADALKALKNLS